MKNRQRKLDPVYRYNQLIICEYLVTLTPIVVVFSFYNFRVAFVNLLTLQASCYDANRDI